MKKILKNYTLNLILGAFVLYAGIMLYMPEASCIRSVPLVIVSGAISRVFLKQKNILGIFSACICFILGCVHGQSLGMAAFYSILCAIFALCGAYVFDCVKKLVLYKKQGKPVFKCAAHGIAVLTLCIALYTVVCGNVFSALYHNNANIKYLDTNYKAMAYDTYTYYSLPEFAYRTCFVFNYEDFEIVGNDGKCFIQNKDGKITDGIRDRYKEDILAVCEKSARTAIASATDYFNISASDISFENNEIITQDKEPADYAHRVDYAVTVYAVEMDSVYFGQICHDIKTALEKNGFEYSSILLVGADADSVNFSATLAYGKQQEALADFKLDKIALDKFKLTSGDILNYWNG